MRTGRIYTIRSFQTDKYYIGSTFQSLSKRIGDHRLRYRKNIRYMTSFEILKYEDHYIELLETLECKSKDELRMREGEIQREHKNDIVNCRIEQRTWKEYRIDNEEKIKLKDKIYRDNNKKKTKQYKKNYRINNQEKIKQTSALYYTNNKEKIKKNAKLYRDNNKERINLRDVKYREKNKVKHNCVCGSIYSKLGKSTHEKTKKHQKYITDNNL